MLDEKQNKLPENQDLSAKKLKKKVKEPVTDLLIPDTEMTADTEGIEPVEPTAEEENKMEGLKDLLIPDKEIENKLLITVAPDGYLKCIKD